MALLPFSAFAAEAEEEYYVEEYTNDEYFEEEYGEDPADVEELYEEGGTVYDLEDEVDVPPVPEETPPPEEAIEEDEDSDIYGDENFDAENAIQLAGDSIPNEYIVKFVDPSAVPGKEKQLAHEIEKFNKIGFVDGLGAYVIKLDDLQMNPNGALNRLKNNKYIESVEPNYTAAFDYAPNDPNYKSQSISLTIIGAPAGWDIMKGGGPIVAVVDSGVAYNPDLPPLLSGYSAVSGLSPNNDYLGHGTGVAGTIGAIGDNGIGGAGINWNASILPVKVDDAGGSLSVANISKGIIWAADNGASVINLSLGTTSDSSTLKSAIDYAYSKGCAIFAATGNDGKNAISYPARYPNVMAVGSTGTGTNRVSSSNYGAGMGTVAIGSYYTTTSTGTYGNMAGTSFASPQVAGLASLILAINPSLSNAEVYDLIQRGAKGNGSYISDELGYGCINIANSLELAQAAGGTGANDAAAKAAAEAEAKAKAEAEAAAAAAAKAEAEAKAAAEAEAKAKAEAEAKAAEEAAAKAKAEAEAKAQAEAEAKAKAEAEAAAKAAAEAAAKAAAEAAAKAEAEAKAAAEAKAKAEAEAAAEAAAKAAAEAAAKAAAEAEAKAKAEAEAAAKAKAEAEAKAAEEAKKAETPQEPPRTAPVITLTGFSEMTLDYGQAYVETGYSAIDCKGLNLTSAVKVTGTVDIWKAGLYTITYEVADSAGLTAKAARTVTVSPKPPDPPPPTAPKITIIGSNPIVLHLTSGTAYKEQMAKAVDHDGTDISNLVTVSGTVNRNTAGTYTLTYSITSPTTGLTSTTTRNVRIVAPTEKKDPRTPYGLSGQAKAGAKVTHTGIVSSELGFMDLKVSSIDKNMTIDVQLVDTATKKAVLTDTFSAAGTKQYKIDSGKYELAVTIDKANGNSKYSIDLLMPETAPTMFFAEEEVPLFGLPQVAPIGSNPIILHIGGTPYKEQGARAVDFLGNDISDQVIITGAPDTTTAGTYTITYTVMSALGVPVSVTRDVRILDPNDETTILEDEVPLAFLPNQQVPLADLPPDTTIYVVVKGDFLRAIALKLYGDSERWQEIYNMNKDIIGGNPDFLKIGQILTVLVT